MTVTGSNGRGRGGEGEEKMAGDRRGARGVGGVAVGARFGGEGGVMVRCEEVGERRGVQSWWMKDESFSTSCR